MKRNEFIQNLAVLGGSFTLLSCGDELISEFVGDGGESISVEEAQKWFDEQYLPKFKGVRESGGNDKKTYKRKAKWDKAEKRKGKDDQEFVWVPVEYEQSLFLPGIVLMDEKTQWKQDVAQYLVEPLIEGFVVKKGKKNTEGALMQLSFSPFSAKREGTKLDLSQYTGSLIKTDWDDNVVEMINYKNGTEVERFEQNVTNGRTAQCYVIEVTYQTVEVQLTPEGTYIWVVKLHKRQRLSCGTTGGSTNLGGGVSVNGGLFQFNPGGNGGGMTDIPNTQQTFIRPNYVVKDALDRNGSQRALLNQRLDDFCKAIGPTLSFIDWNNSMGEAITKIVGAQNLKVVYPVSQVVGRTFGAMSLIMDGREVWILMVNGSMRFQDLDNWDKAKVVLLGAAATAFFFEIWWLAVASATMSVGMAVVKELM